MKRFLCILFCSVVIACVLTGCGLTVPKPEIKMVKEMFPHRVIGCKR